MSSVGPSDWFQGSELRPPVLKLLDQLFSLKLSCFLHNIPHKPSPNFHRPSLCLKVLENGIIVWRKKGEKTREEERKIERKREKERRRNKKEREARKIGRKRGKKYIERVFVCVCVCKNSAVTESEPQECAGFDSKQTRLLAYSFLVFLSP